jgi:hypothetical protein
MSKLQYVLFDNALQGTGLSDWPVDEFADVLRVPLAAIGVIVDRRKGHGITIGIGELRGAESFSIGGYRKKYGEVDRVVRSVLRAKREKG